MTLFRPEALAHRRRKVHGDVILAKPVGFAVLTITFTMATALIIFFLLTNEFNRRETAQGWIEPSGGMVVLRPSQSGRIADIFIKVGDIVTKGDPLFSLNVDLEGANGKAGVLSQQALSAQIKEITLRIANTKDRYRLEAERLTAANAQLQTKLTLASSEIQTLKKSAKMSLQQLEKLETLGKAGHVPSLQTEQQRQVWLSETAKVQSRTIVRQSLLSDLQNNIHILKSLPNQQERILSELRQQLHSLIQQQSQAAVSSQLLIRSPIAGRVIMVHGQVGQLRIPGKPVVSLSPMGKEMEASLLVPPSAIGFLEPNQQVNLMIDAFPYQKFGMQSGRIQNISKASFLPGELQSPFDYKTSVYKVTVRLEKQTIEIYGKTTPFLPGMTLSGDLIVDRRTLFEWVFEPLFTTKSRT